ncbi:MAG: cytochrome c [Bacteroidetes bacterium]|nr:cytochrome c [Bacteroidota bacterium]
MFLRIWILLFLVFLSYTIYLYINCDTGRQIPVERAVVAGRDLWQKKNCQACHQLYGLGGYMGPDLTNITRTKGENSTAIFIKYGTGKMPNLQLSDAEVQNLVAYLSWVDKSGTSKVPENKVHWSGTYLIDTKQ